MHAQFFPVQINISTVIDSPEIKEHTVRRICFVEVKRLMIPDCSFKIQEFEILMVPVSGNCQRILFIVSMLFPVGLIFWYIRVPISFRVIFPSFFKTVIIEAGFIWINYILPLSIQTHCFPGRNIC